MTASVPPGSAFILAGPTASGKTDVAHRLARDMGCEILSADSMLVYRGMDIGTAKPDAGLRGELRYHGLDLVDPGAPFSLSLYLEEASRAVAGNRSRGRGLVVVGGTGLYIKALVDGVDDSPPADPALREVWEARFAAEGVAPLWRALQDAYPALAASLTESDRWNSRRLIRALELGAAGCVTVKRKWGGASANPPITALRLPMPLLRSRIERRVRRMYADGLLDEVRRLFKAGLENAPTACQAIGYAEAIACLNGSMTEAAAQAETILRTSQLAKRQMTWFRNQAQIRWIDLDRDLPAEVVADLVRAAWRETGPIPICQTRLTGPTCPTHPTS